MKSSCGTKKMAKGGIMEYGGKEKYASKAAMKKHEMKESPRKEKMEKSMKMAKGGQVMCSPRKQMAMGMKMGGMAKKGKKGC